MLVTQRIPTSQFAYLEYESEFDSIEEAMAEHKRLLTLYEEQTGLGSKEWAEVRNKMLETGEFDPNLFGRLSHSQRWWINETKKALRSFSKDEEEVIN